MSELIQTHDNRATIRWKLLTGASALALTAYVASTALARAEEADRPALWIELGGQMEQMQGLYSTPFTAPFLFYTPTPAPYQGVSINGIQRPSRFAFGAEGKISFQPEDSDWIFSAGIRYGRSHGKQHVHHQTAGLIEPYYTYPYHGISFYDQFKKKVEFLDAAAQSSEHHMVLDFSAGKDIGIGLLGHNGSSTLSAGARILDISENMSGTVYARPHIGFIYQAPKYIAPQADFHGYTMNASAERNFNGIGPSLSWSASAAVAGNEQDGELTLDWSLNAAMLFGRQKAKTIQSTQGNHFYYSAYGNVHYPQTYSNAPPPRIRSRRVTVPNMGGSAGISLKWSNAKISFGYRYDTFLKAMDTGIATRETSNLTFHGPYASISIGLGD